MAVSLGEREKNVRPCALIDLPAVIAQLQTTTFYGPPDIIAAMLAHDTARKRPL